MDSSVNSSTTNNSTKKNPHSKNKKKSDFNQLDRDQDPKTTSIDTKESLSTNSQNQPQKLKLNPKTLFQEEEPSSDEGSTNSTTNNQPMSLPQAIDVLNARINWDDLVELDEIMQKMSQEKYSNKL